MLTSTVPSSILSLWSSLAVRYKVVGSQYLLSEIKWLKAKGRTVCRHVGVCLLSPRNAKTHIMRESFALTGIGTNTEKYWTSCSINVTRLLSLLLRKGKRQEHIIRHCTLHELFKRSSLLCINSGSYSDGYAVCYLLARNVTCCLLHADLLLGLLILPCRRRRNVPPKSGFTINWLQGVIYQKTQLFMCGGTEPFFCSRTPRCNFSSTLHPKVFGV
jgi:hypothetical protein